MSYLSNRSASGDYLASGRAGDFDVFKLFPKTNAAQMYKGGRGRAIKRFGAHFWKYRNKFASCRKKQFRTNVRCGVFEKIKAEIAEEVGVDLTGDFEHRMEGMSMGRKFARFGCGELLTL